MNYNLLSIISAYFLDLILGDPQWQWHPVRFIGRLIEYLEGKLNTDKFNKRLSGGVLIIVVVGLAVFFVWGALRLANFCHPILYYLFLTLFIYFGLSVKALAVEAGEVGDALMHKDIERARKKLSMIVGRDTEKLDEPQIIRATVETVAESIMDGIVAPIFYCFLGGPVLMWAYKAVNTLDSMVGYRSERFKEFGWVSAKLDDMANFIPAKISLIFLLISSWLSGHNALDAWRIALRDGKKNPSPNSGLPEAAMAGALGIQLGGLNFYNSVANLKPYIGDNNHPLDIKHIKEGIKIAYISSALFMAMGLFLFWLIGS